MPRLKSLHRSLKEAVGQRAASGAPSPLPGAPLRTGAGRALEPRLLLDAAALETLDRTTDLVDLSAFEGADDDQQLDALASEQRVLGGTSQLVIIDESVAGWRDLVDQLGDDVQVEFISSDRDGVIQLAEIISRYDGLTSLHLISHGADGLVRIGNTSLTLAELSLYQEALASIGAAFVEGADWFIYGCDLAASDDGKALVNALAELTGLDVAASEDATGSVDGANWILEYSTGLVDHTGVLELAINGTLAWINVGQDGGSASGEWVGADIAADGKWIVAGTYIDKVHIYEVVGPNRVLVQTITTSAAAATAGANGHSVDVSGDFLIFRDRASSNVQVWRWNGSADAWQLSNQWNHGTGAQYGDVAIEQVGARVWVGSSWLNNSGYALGATGVVRFMTSANSGGTWSQAGSDLSAGGSYGGAIAIASNIALVGQPGDSSNRGRVYRYSLADGGATLLASHTPVNRGSTSHNPALGYSVDAAWDGTNVYWVAGGPLSYTPWWAADRYGYVDIYTGSQGQTHTANIRGENVVGGDDLFGRSVAISIRGGGQASVMVGAPSGHSNDGWSFRFDNVVGRGNIGSANANYIGASSSGERMGWSVAMTRDYLVSGGPLSNAVALNGGRMISWFDYGGVPVANADSVTINQNTTIDINALGNDFLANNRAVNPVTVFVVGDNRGGIASVVQGATPLVRFNPLEDFKYLGLGQDLASHSADGLGTIKIEYEIIDAFGNASKAIISVNVTGLNDAPVVDKGIPDRVGENSDNAGTAVSYQIPANAFFDIDQSDVLQYYFVSLNQVAGATTALAVNVSTGGLITYTPTLAHWDTRYVLTVRAQDPHGAWVESSFVINIDRPNEAPTADSTPVALEVWQQNNTPDGQVTSFPYDMSQHFDDPDFYKADPRYGSEGLRYSIISGQNWLSIGAFDGVLTANAQNQHVGVHNVTIQVRDEFGQTAQKTIQITVHNVNDAPIVTNTIPGQVAYIGQIYSYTAPANLFTDIDVPADSITWAAYFADGTPVGDASYTGPGAWLRFNPATREFYSNGNVSGAIGARVEVYIRATDNGSTDLSGGGSLLDPKYTDYLFDIDIFPVPGVLGSVGSVAGGDFGRSTAISENGDTWVGASPKSNTNQGLFHVYRWNGSGWTWIEGIVVGGSTANDYGGYSVALSSAGDRLVIGSPGWNGDRGRVSLYQWNGTNFVLQRHIEGTTPGERFGFSVSVNSGGGRVLIGAPGSNLAAQAAGAVYEHTFADGTRRQTILPVAEPGGSIQFASFGFSVAYNRTVAVIGAPYETIGSASFAGSVTVLRYDGSTFVDRTKLHRGSDARQGDFLGWSVDVDVFRGIGTSSVTSSVVVAAGAPGTDGSGLNQGQVLVWRTDNLSGTIPNLFSLANVATLSAYDGTDGYGFGSSVAIDVDAFSDIESTGGLRLVVGADISVGGGGVYAYKWQASNGFVGQRFNHSASPSGGSTFGWSVDISGMRFVAGAPGISTLYQGSTNQAGSLVESTGLSGTGDKFMEDVQAGSGVTPGLTFRPTQEPDRGLGVTMGRELDELYRRLVPVDAIVEEDRLERFRQFSLKESEGATSSVTFDSLRAGVQEQVMEAFEALEVDPAVESQPQDGEAVAPTSSASEARGFSDQLKDALSRLRAPAQEVLGALDGLAEDVDDKKAGALL
jgi:hypothetical protein